MTGLGHAEMPSAYAAMDVLVLPSLTTLRWAEQFGRGRVEALWCGVPVVGSDSGEIPWVIETTRGGRVVPEGDPTALAKTLAELRDDLDQRLLLATRGHDAVERQFSVSAVADALDDVLNDVIFPNRRNAASEGRAPRRPTIALVAHGIHDHGGMERACAELIRHAHHEFAFTAVTAELAPDLRPLVARWVPVRVPMHPIPRKFLVFFVRAGAALRRLDLDLIHTVGAIVPSRVDVASIHFCHAGHLAATGELGPRDAPVVRRVNTGLARRLALAAERWCYRPGRLRAFAAVSQGTAEELARHYPGIPVTVTPNGVDTARFHPDGVTRRRVRAEVGVDDEMVALFVGGDWERKGLLLAIEAVANAGAAGVDVALWVVGPGDERRFSSLAADVGVSDRVRFFGRRRDTERFYQAADVFVLPSAYETFSIVSFEAAACGLPLLIPSLHGAAELVGDNDGGIIIQRDPASIAAALKELSDEPTRVRMGAAAQARVREFTWERSAAATVAVYRSLLSGSPRWA
jgi:glycosyltransferase involved in cell wall biosynthesis